VVTSEQRRKQLAREKYVRQQERRARARRKTRLRNAGVAFGLVLVLAAGAAYAATGGLNGDDTKDNAADTEAAPTPSKGPDPCEKPAKGKPSTEQWKKEPELAVDKSASYTLALETTCGRIGIDLDAADAPHTVNSFRVLAGAGYFDHSGCHRLTTKGIFVLQCGDPTGQGNGGPGYTIPDENLKDPRLDDGVYPRGTVAMANTGQKDTGGSQFFLVYKDSKLPPKYTPFGTIDDAGLKVLEKIADAGTPAPTGDGAPNATVTINKATVSTS
jgi:peptidyl-prolyl cis-trans isomerase B (cyclophilin B)